MSDKRKPKHGADGRFIKGGGGGPGRPPAPNLDDMDLPDPPARLAALGLSDAWRALAFAATQGNISAALKLAEWAEKYGERIEESGPGARYSGVPAEVGELLAELDIGLGDILHRYRLGFCLEDVELLAVEAAEAVRKSGPSSRAASRWAGHEIPEIQKLRANQNPGVGV